MVGILGLGYKATLNSNIYANIPLLALLDYVKELYLLRYVDEQSYKATSKLKKHVFDICFMNARCIFDKHFLDANDAYQSYRATAIFILLSIVFGLLVSNLRFGYKATLYSSMYANMRL